MTNVGVINLGLSNLGSLLGALKRLETDFLIIDQPRQLGLVGRLIIPGVGNFSRAIFQLEGSGLFEPIQDFSATHKPIMGICLGMQLLAEGGQEGTAVRGLGLVEGFSTKLQEDGLNRVPHMGWNSLNLLKSHPVLDRVPNGSDFYFVHSYAISDFKTQEALATTTHGRPFLSAVTNSNVIGFQFHPEKSQRKGQRIIQNFIEWDGTC